MTCITGQTPGFDYINTFIIYYFLIFKKMTLVIKFSIQSKYILTVLSCREYMYH